MKKEEIPKYLNGEGASKKIARWIIFAIAFFVLIIVIGFLYIGMTYQKLSQLQYEVSGNRPITEENYVDLIEEEEVIPSDVPTFEPPLSTPVASPTPTLVPELSSDITNILVLGCDTRQPGVYENARSDVNIILTIDKLSNQVKITSIMRDTLVYYDEMKDYQRINYALRYYDDPNGVVETIEKNFGVEIDHYMLTDFWGMERLIDIFGGVEVYATEPEIENLNDILWNLNELYGYEDLREDFVTDAAGEITLSGRQAVAYMRVRKVGADYERVQRQYEVLSAVKNELSTVSFIELNKIIQQLPNLLKTDMSQMEIISTVGTLYKMRDVEMKNARVPFDGHYKSATYKKMSILDIDLEKNRELLYDFIYGKPNEYINELDE